MYPVGTVVVAAAIVAVAVAVAAVVVVVAAAAVAAVVVEAVVKGIVEVETVVGHTVGIVQLRPGYPVLGSTTGLVGWPGLDVAALGIAVGSRSFGMGYGHCSYHAGH